MNTSQMTDEAFYTYAKKVRYNCPQGVAHFCDGTPNLSQPGNREKKPKCKHFINNKCRYFRERGDIECI